jgi:cytochrome c peroxidase
MRAATCHLLLAAALALASSTGQAEDQVVFTAAEIQVILSHGPWPMRVPEDPSNRVSGQYEAIELGKHLFFDPRLSGSGTLSCGSCHVPDRNWTDNLRRGVGMAEVERNTPSLMNIASQSWYGWGGGSDSLWAQNLKPIVDPRELASSPGRVAQLVRSDEQIACRYRKTFGAAPSPADDEAVYVDVGKALAAFVETLVSGHTPFDQFRDALARGEQPQEGTFSEAAQRGLKIFIGKGGCENCHSGPNFTSGEFFKTGLSKFAPLGKPDPGREAGIRQLLESRYNLAGRYNDDASDANAARTRKVALEKGRFGEFKVPSLRNLVLTGPYGRDGETDTLAQVVKHYSGIDPARLRARDGKPGKPLDLTQREQTDLVVFLESLSTFSNGWRPDIVGTCR